MDTDRLTGPQENIRVLRRYFNAGLSTAAMTGSVLMGSLLALSACDSEPEYEAVDVHVYFYFPNDKEVYLGQTRGASSCGDIAGAYAYDKGFSMYDDWNYQCCTIEHGSDCYRAIR